MNRKIIDYYLIQGTTRYVASQVKIRISEGWQPLGGVSFISGAGESYGAQAMVKYEEGLNQSTEKIK